MITYEIACGVGFKMFGGKDLAPGWTLKEIRLTGSYRWYRKPEAGGNSAEFSIIMTRPSGSQQKSLTTFVKHIVLIGPKNSRWQKAFGGY